MKLKQKIAIYLSILIGLTVAFNGFSFTNASQPTVQDRPMHSSVTSHTSQPLQVVTAESRDAVVPSAGFSCTLSNSISGSVQGSVIPNLNQLSNCFSLSLGKVETQPELAVTPLISTQAIVVSVPEPIIRAFAITQGAALPETIRQVTILTIALKVLAVIIALFGIVSLAKQLSKSMVFTPVMRYEVLRC
jgi:hypothetical protein